MRVLITGSQGYVGCVLAAMARGGGHDVVGADTDLFRDCTFGDGDPGQAQMTTDIRDLGVNDLQGFQAVIHLAGLSNDPLGDLDPAVTAAINAEATVTLAAASRSAGVERFVFASSCSNYGPAGESLVAEDQPLAPLTPYAVSKVRAEQGLAALAGDSFSPVMLRSATAYGLSPRLRFDLVLNNLTAWAVAANRVRLKSDGMAWRPLVHVEDMARAFLAVLEAPREAVHNEAFNVGRTNENFRVRELAEIVREAAPGASIEYAEGAVHDERCYRVSFDKIRERVPAFQPLRTVLDGARELAAAFGDAALTVDQIEGRRYNRVSHVRWRLEQGDLSPNLRWSESCTAADPIEGAA